MLEREREKVDKITLVGANPFGWNTEVIKNGEWSTDFDNFSIQMPTDLDECILTGEKVVGSTQPG